MTHLQELALEPVEKKSKVSWAGASIAGGFLFLLLSAVFYLFQRDNEPTPIPTPSVSVSVSAVPTVTTTAPTFPTTEPTFSPSTNPGTGE